MAEHVPQTYATHAHRPTLAIVAFTAGVVAAAIFVAEAFDTLSAVTVGLLALAAAVLCLALASRRYTVRLQDRIIRLEMRLRLERLGRGSAFERLSIRQLVALRFASDAELPALADRALAENLTGKEIKQAVRDWQPDHHRA